MLLLLLLRLFRCLFSLLCRGKWPSACCDRSKGERKLPNHEKPDSKAHRKAADPAIKKAAFACLIAMANTTEAATFSGGGKPAERNARAAASARSSSRARRQRAAARLLLGSVKALS